MSNTILVRPLINLFNGEFKGADFRKKLNVMATQPEYKNKVKQLILDSIKMYAEINHEALDTVNGIKVVRPSRVVEEELLVKQEKFGELSEKDLAMLQKL